MSADSAPTLNSTTTAAASISGGSSSGGWRAVKRRQEKQRRRERHRLAVRQNVASGASHVSKRDAKALLDARLEAATSHGRPTVCLDCGGGCYESAMSDKEVDKLAKQLNRLYGVHRAARSMVRLCLTGYRADSRLATVAGRKYAAHSYRLARLAGSPAEEFPDRPVTYLSPDAARPLRALDPDGVYVIGGLVDEQRRPGASAAAAAAWGLATARLPIDDHVIGRAGAAASLDRLPLPVNVVFAVLCDVANGDSWTEALMRRLPQRLRLRPRY